MCAGKVMNERAVLSEGRGHGVLKGACWASPHIAVTQAKICPRLCTSSSYWRQEALCSWNRRQRFGSLILIQLNTKSFADAGCKFTSLGIRETPIEYCPADNIIFCTGHVIKWGLNFSTLTWNSLMLFCLCCVAFAYNKKFKYDSKLWSVASRTTLTHT